ncbi:MAG: zinc-binding dehydrogenase [Pseudomonadota bacterium]
MSNLHGKGVVLLGPDVPLELREFEIPPAEAGGAVVKVVVGGICGTDVHLRKGEFPLAEPITLGHEGIGEIVDLGGGRAVDYAGVPVSVGDRVYWCPSNYCHHCYYCTVVKNFAACENQPILSHARTGAWGSYADYAFLPSGMPFYRVPDGVPVDALIAFGCALPAVLQAFDRLGRITSLETVVVQGSGPIGLAATLMAHLSGARRVITIGAPAHRLEMARRFGADETLLVGNQSEKDLIARVRELTDGRGPDIIVEAAGHLSAFTQGLEMIARNGRYLLIGLWAGADKVPVDPHALVRHSVRVIGSDRAEGEHYYQALKIVERNWHRFPFTEIVTHRFSLEDAESGLRAVARGETLKAVVVPGAHTHA